MFTVRIYEGCCPEGNYVEFEVTFDMFPKLVFQAVSQDHCLSVVDVTDNEKYIIKFPEV